MTYKWCEQAKKEIHKLREMEQTQDLSYETAKKLIICNEVCKILEMNDYWKDYNEKYRGAKYPEHNEKGYGEEHIDYSGKKLSKELAMKWVSEMHNSDGTKGQHWSMDQTTSVANQNNVSFDDFSESDFYITMNMMHSDYCDVAKTMGVDTVTFYLKMALAFLYDDDAVPAPQKLYCYYNHIVAK